MKLYFAYGSNMWNEQMGERCPHHRKLGRADLPGYRWIISSRGYATILVSPIDLVEGVLYELSLEDEEFLDRKEGKSYYKKMVSVLWEGKATEAFTYIDHVTAEGIPSDEYADRINKGAMDAGLSEAYIVQTFQKYVLRTQ